jgi:putative salt-induced outer membrane protein YdiY
VKILSPAPKSPGPRDARFAGMKDLEGASEMRIRNRRLLVLFWLALGGSMIWPALAAAAKAPERRDVVVMKNGDIITGKIKRLEHGQLYIEPPYVVSPIPVDWLQVDRIETTAKFQVEMSGGKRLVGTILKSPTKDNPNQDFVIDNGGVATRVRAIDVVAFQSQKNNFWRQLKGSVNLGASYVSGSTATSVNLDADTSYSTTKYEIGAALSSNFSNQTGATSSNRQDLSSSSSLYLTRHAFVGSYLDFLTSDQQSLDLRQTYGGGYGRYFIRTNNTEFSWLGGLVYVKEAYSPESGMNPKDQNVEGLFELNYDWFRFNTSELSTSLQVFPGISDAGRLRSNLNSTYSVNFTRDIVLRVNLFDTFDNRPPENALKNQFGISTTFGLTF